MAQGAQMQAVAQGTQVDNAAVPSGTSSVSVQGSAGTNVNFAAPSLGTTTRGGGIIPQCTRHSLNSYYATDHLGTVRFTKTIDETGTEVATSTHDYEPFGVEITPADTCDNTHKFTGHERDIETGNDYMHFRFFASNMGRFQKPDSNFDNPGANPQGWNLYSYVKGNPVNFNDPTGHMPALHRGTWHPQFPQHLTNGRSPQSVFEDNGDSFGNVIVNGLWTGEYVHLDDGDGNPSSGFYTTSNATVGTNWGAWYKFYGVGSRSSQSGTALAPSVMLASTGGLPSALWEMFWTGLTGAAGSAGDVADIGATLLEGGQAFASLKLEGLSFDMGQLLNAFLNYGHFGALQRNDLFDKGVDAWNEVHNNSMGKGALAISASVREAISASSDAIMQIRQSLGMSYEKLIDQVQQGWSNHNQIDWMEWYERSHML